MDDRDQRAASRRGGRSADAEEATELDPGSEVGDAPPRRRRPAPVRRAVAVEGAA